MFILHLVKNSKILVNEDRSICLSHKTWVIRFFRK